MLRLLTYIFVSVIFSVTEGAAQNFEALTSRIFFNVNPTLIDTSIYSNFRSKPELTVENRNGWTVYPPVDKEGNLLFFETYAFSKHAYFSSNISKGYLIVLADSTNSKIMGLTLSVKFTTRPGFDSTYNEIMNQFKRHSVNSIKRPNIADPFEVTKFESKEGTYLIITKGESEGLPYLHFSYNYQDDSW